MIFVSNEWREIPIFGEPDLPDEVAVSCYLAKVYFYSKDRNAWHETRAEGNSRYSLSKPSLINQAEDERGRGWKAQISEEPAIVFAGTSLDLVMLEYGDSPFKNTSMKAIPAGKLKDLYAYIRPSITASVRAYVAARGSVPLAHLPFKRYESFSDGIGNPLRWQEDIRSGLNLTFITSVIRDVCISLHVQR